MVTTFLLLVIVSPVWGMLEARLVGLSTSGKTVVLNLGKADKLIVGEHAVLVQQVRDLDEKDLRVIPIARAKNLKINSDQSVWVLYKIYDAKALTKGQKFMVFTESTSTKGRRDIETTKTSLVSPKDETAPFAKMNLNMDEDRLAKKRQEYVEIGKMHGPEVRMDKDAELLDLEEWEKNKDAQYRTSIYKSPSKTDFERNFRLATFEKLVTGYLKKVNDPNFNYDVFYENQMRENYANEFRKKPSVPNEYEDYRLLENVQAENDAKLYRSLLEKGDRWSEDFSDEELGKTLNRVSILQERDRRNIVVSIPKRYALGFEYGVPLTDAQTEKDTAYRRDSRYSMELGLEVVPIIKHPTLERFTLDASFRVNKTAISNNNLNADVNETSVALGANWYPLYNSYTVEAPLVFLGAFIRSGYANVTSPSANEKANYTVLSIPGFRAGFRYLMRNQFGIKVVATMESIRLSQYEDSKFDSNLPENSTLVEGKVGVGLTYSF